MTECMICGSTAMCNCTRCSHCNQPNDKCRCYEPRGAGPDLVNAPPHYRQGDIECIDAIRAMLTPEEFRGFVKGNVVKYCWRERHKGGDESLAKADWYLGRLV